MMVLRGRFRHDHDHKPDVEHPRRPGGGLGNHLAAAGGSVNGVVILAFYHRFRYRNG